MESGQEFEDQLLVMQYLLGELEEEMQAKIQDRLLCDREFFDRLAIKENELIDDYVRGALTRDRQEKFENYFLISPERHRKLRFAKALNKRLSEAPQPKLVVAMRPPSNQRLVTREFSLRRFAAGTAAALILAVGVWLAVENARLRRKVDDAQAERDEWIERTRQLERQVSIEKQHGQMLAEKVERETGDSSRLERETGSLKRATGVKRLVANPKAKRLPTREAIVSLALLPWLAREGDESRKVEILPATSHLRLELYPEKTDHETYRAELRTREDERIWIGNNLKLRRTTLGDQVIVNLPATILSKGDYVLTLHSIADEGDQERAGTYYVRVVK